MNKDKLVKAYSEFMQHLHETMEDTLHFGKALDISKEKTSQNSDLTTEELDQVSSNVQRDVEHAAQNLPHQASEETFGEWLKFEVQLIEDFAIDAFLSVADKTRIQLEEIKQHAIAYKYESGDVTAPGTFVCDNCGKEIAFKTPSQIPECPACHGKIFVRV
ncbi:hypothetical protein BAC3_00713 [uncultured bacterium]|nr:hypothetical protein BAC3_00713 [uncultured bacterium]